MSLHTIFSKNLQTDSEIFFEVLFFLTFFSCCPGTVSRIGIELWMRGAGPSFPKSVKIARGITGKSLLEVSMMSEQKRPYRFLLLEFTLWNNKNNIN